MLDLFVLDAAFSERKPVFVGPATAEDLTATQDWRTNWTTPFAAGVLNEVAICYLESDELLGRMFYELNQGNLAVEIIYFESVRHSNANLLRIHGGHRRYSGIPKALFAYATQVSIEAGFDGVLVFRAKSTELLNYYQ